MNNTTVCKKLAVKFISKSITHAELQQFAQCYPNETLTHTIELENEDKYELMTNLAIAYCGILLITSMLGVIGNLFVICVYAKKYKSLNPWKFLNLHLACCDLIFALMQFFSLVPAVHEGTRQFHWPFGLAFCKISQAALLMGGLVAVQTILIIALERYQAVLLHQNWQRHAHNRVKKALAFSWMFALVSCIPVLLLQKIHKATGHCCNAWEDYPTAEKIFHVYLLLLFAILPMLIITFCYVKVIRELRKQNRSTVLENTPPERERKRREVELHVVKMLAFVVIAFFLCVLPGRVVNVIICFAGGDIPYEREAAYAYIGFLPYPFHVVINPIMLCLMNREFRESICRKRDVDNSGLVTGEENEVAMEDFDKGDT